jgi:hypothetical protein
MMISILVLGGCVMDQYKPALDMSGDSVIATFAGNTIVSDTKTIPGAPATAFMGKDGTVSGANLRQQQGSQPGAWTVNERGYMCVKWPNWIEFQCGFVLDYQNGEYFWRGNSFRILPGNPHAI